MKPVICFFLSIVFSFSVYAQVTDLCDSDSASAVPSKSTLLAKLSKEKVVANSKFVENAQNEIPKYIKLD